MVPQELKNSQALYSFKKGIRNGNQIAHVAYAKPTCNMLVLHNNRAWY